MRSLQGLILAFLLSQSATARPGPGADSAVFAFRWEAGARYHAGFLMAHRPVIAYLQRNHAGSFQCHALKKTDGSVDWHRIYGLPLIGISYRLTDFGNREEIGLGHSLVMMARFPLFPKNRKWQLTLDFGYGLGLIERPFDLESNYKNLATGSFLNAAFNMAISTSYPVSQKFRLLGGLDFLHFSNGAARMPNLGLNVPGFFLGMTYPFNPIRPSYTGQSNGPKTEEEKTVQSPPFRKTRIYSAFGLKETYPPNDGAYPIYVFNAQHHGTVRRKGLFGGGLDLIYDTSLPTKKSRDSGEPKKTGIAATFRGGLFGSAGLQMGPWSAYLQTGAYFANPVKSDGDIYNRLALHYQFKQGLFLCVNLKSHFGKADYIEWGAGYSF